MAARAPNFRSCVEKDFYFGIRKNPGSDVAAFHDDSACGADLALALHHPFAHAGMDGDFGSCIGYIRKADSVGDVLAIEQYAIAFRPRLKFDV